MVTRGQLSMQPLAPVEIGGRFRRTGAGHSPLTTTRMAFHVEQTVPALVAAIAGTGTYGLQAANTAANPIPYLTLGMTVVSVIVAGAVAWGVQKADSRRTRADVEKLSALMLETVQRLSRIEAKLER